MQPVDTIIPAYKNFKIAVLLSVGIMYYPVVSEASTGDTLQINGERIVDGLANAHTLQVLPPEELIITESGADRIITFQIRFQKTTIREDAVMKHSSDSDEEVYVSQLDQPGALAMIMDTYYAVISNGTGRIHLLDEKMSYMRSLNVPSWVLNGETLAPHDITSTGIGELFLLDSRHKKIYHFNPNGSYLQYIDISRLGKPLALMHAEESLFVSDGDTGLIHVLTENGHELATIGSFPELARVRVLDRLIWVISGSVIHLFDIYGDHVGNWRLAGSEEPIRDIALIDEQLFILTPGSLYFSGTLLQ